MTAAEAERLRDAYEAQRREYTTAWRLQEGASMAKRGLFTCADRAMPDEPVFELLARDPDFARLVRSWADTREAAIKCGDRPDHDREQVREARAIAAEGELWRTKNLYSWRRLELDTPSGTTLAPVQPAPAVNVVEYDPAKAQNPPADPALAHFPRMNLPPVA